LDIFKASLLASILQYKHTDFLYGAQLAKSIHTNDKSLEITPCRISIFLYYKFNRVGNRKDNGNGQDQQIGSTVVGNR
jgi:hypothetical protein